MTLTKQIAEETMREREAQCVSIERDISPALRERIHEKLARERDMLLHIATANATTDVAAQKHADTPLSSQYFAVTPLPDFL